MDKKFFVTTPVYYPNEKLHIGHAYTTILADYINKYKKMQGYETMFLTGSDEHGQKIFDKAKESNQSPHDFVTKIVDKFKELWKELGVDYDLFIRTTDKRHELYVKNIFTDFLKNDFIYEDNYIGLYCKSDESYFTSTQSPNKKCPICGNTLDEISEPSFFLKVSKFKKWIENELLNSNLLEPKYRINELVNNFIKDLKDLSITRTSFNWGIKINENKKHVVYVWLDALLNYISALTFKESKFNLEEVWSKDSNVEILQLIGKEITRFHCIYWPVILKIKNYRNPKIFAHGWLVADDGSKMSKSKGNTVDPIPLINNYGRDSLRFYLVNNIITGEDGKFSNELLEETINGLLVNKYSNLVARTDSMVKKYFNNVVPKALIKNINFQELNKKLDLIKDNYFKSMDKYKFSDSTKLLIKYIEELNGYIDITEPWKKNGEELSLILNTLVNNIFNITLLLSPLLIDSSKKIYNWLCINKVDKLSFKDLNKDFAGVKLNNIEHLFTRIEKKR